MKTKKCTKCGNTKELSQYQESKKSTEGVNAHCNSCASEIMAKFYLRKYDTKKTEIKTRKKLEVKQCNECKSVKSFPHFTKQSDSPDGHGYTCRPCVSKLKKEYAKALRKELNRQTTLKNGYVTRRENARELAEIKKKIQYREKCLSTSQRNKPVVYVSLPIGFGKMPNIDQLKLAKKRAAKIANQLSALGYRAETPFTIGVPENGNYNSVMQYCLQYLVAVRPVMFFMDGWQQSYGCTKEWFKTHDLGLTLEKENTNGLYALQHRAEVLNVHPNYALVV